MGGVRGGVDEGFLLFPNNDRCRRKVSAQTRLLDIKRVGKALPSGESARHTGMYHRKKVCSG